MNPSLLALSYFAHLLATVVWIGGMALIVLIAYPLPKEYAPMIDTLERRFRPYANFSLLVLLLTGVVQTSGDGHYGGLLQFDNDWSRAILAKHLAFFGMMGIVAFFQFGLEPALERARLLAKKSEMSDDLLALQNRQRQLTRINFVLGLVVLGFTAIATAL